MKSKLYDWKDKQEIADAFRTILSSCDFGMHKSCGKYHLDDLQGGNLGDIESDTFETTQQVIERLDIYIDDYFVKDIQECLNITEYNDYGDLKNKVIALNKDGEFDLDIKVLDFITNAPEMKLNDIWDYIKGDFNYGK